jgi:hypothetical protein
MTAGQAPFPSAPDGEDIDVDDRMCPTILPAKGWDGRLLCWG